MSYCPTHDQHNCQHPEHGYPLSTAMLDKPVTWAPTPGEPYRLHDLVPMRDRLLVAPLAVASRSRGGIHLAETSHQRERPQHGVVLKTGPGVWKDGRLQPVQAKAGDCVFYGKYSGQEFVLGDRSILNMGEIEVFSILPQGAFVVIEHENPKHNHLQGDYCDICATPAEKEARAALDAERARLVAERAAAAGVQALEVQNGGLVAATEIAGGAGAAGAGPSVPQAAEAAAPATTNPLEEERERLRQARRLRDAEAEA